MKDNNFYTWKDNQLTVVDADDFGRIQEFYTNHLMVDGRFESTEPRLKYGKYIVLNNEADVDWYACSLDEFPEEFKVQLMLLGVL